MKKSRELVGIVFILVLLSVFIGRIVVNVKAQDGETAVYLPIVLNNYDSAWEWQVPITVTLTPTASSPPVSAIDGEGRVHLIWSTL